MLDVMEPRAPETDLVVRCPLLGGLIGLGECCAIVSQSHGWERPGEGGFALDDATLARAVTVCAHCPNRPL